MTTTTGEAVVEANAGGAVVERRKHARVRARGLVSTTRRVVGVLEDISLGGARLALAGNAGLEPGRSTLRVTLDAGQVFEAEIECVSQTELRSKRFAAVRFCRLTASAVTAISALF